MKTVLVTGASGFIGQNLCKRLEAEHTVLRYTRDDSLDTLKAYIERSDFVFHLAAVMRPQDDGEFREVNTELTETLLNLITESKKKVPFLLTSSIQADLDNPYGESKKNAEEIVRHWGRTNEQKTYIYRLPNVFGPLSKPNYSSVVATFCYNIAHGINIEIHDAKKTLTLAYIDDIVDEFIKSLDEAKQMEKDGYYNIPRVFQVTLQELADVLYRIHSADTSHTSFHPSNDFEKILAVTYTYFKSIM
jgi:UDP-2-acetamido-2,6-beta-L-arabino-hexul-4-ose reductase